MPKKETLTKKVIITSLFVVMVFLHCGHASSAVDLEETTSSGNTAFVVVVDSTVDHIEQAKALVKEARNKILQSVMVILDRSSAENADFVAKYRLQTAPVPLIMVAVKGGIIVGSVAAEKGSADMLVKMIPSPKKLEVIKVLQERKAVFIVAQKKSMQSAEDICDRCTKASQQMDNKSVLVKMDMDDQAEAGFLSLLKINTASAEPVTIVGNARGQITDTYTGPMSVEDLVQAATRSAGGCCPRTVTGGGGTCTPQK
ncbi:MAG: hypothetical protein ABSC04_07640 [Syntrophobacteraceae bacterium]